MPLARRRLSGGVQLPAGVPRRQSVHAGRHQLHLLADRRRLHPETGERAVSTQVEVTHAVVGVAVGVHVLCVAVESKRPGDLPRHDPGVAEDSYTVGSVAMTQALPVEFVHVKDVVVRSTCSRLIARFDICEFGDHDPEKLRLKFCVLKLVNLVRMLQKKCGYNVVFKFLSVI